MGILFYLTKRNETIIVKLQIESKVVDVVLEVKQSID